MGNPTAKFAEKTISRYLDGEDSRSVVEYITPGYPQYHHISSTKLKSTN